MADVASADVEAKAAAAVAAEDGKTADDGGAGE